MKKLLLLFSFFLFTFLLQPQGLGLLNIEEHGSPIGYRSDEDPVPTDATQWEVTTNSPSFFGRAVFGSIGDYMYIFSSQNATSLAQAYHIPTKTWVASTSVTAPGFNSSSCVANGKLYKMGGSGASTTFEVFTPAGDGTGSWAVLTAGPSQVMGPEGSIVWDNGNYIYASAASTASPPVGYFHRYNITTNTWEQMASPPFGRRYAGMTCIGNFIYRIGGLGDAAGDLTTNYKYDITNNTWSPIASSLEALNFTKWSVANDGEKLYLVGAGGGFSGYSIQTKVYMYNPATDAWSIESDLPATRGLAVGAFMPSVRKLFYGGGNDGTSGTAYQVHCWEGAGGPYIPVELTSFRYEAGTNGIILHWETASEVNNKMFRVEKSLDNTAWQTAGTVAGSGSTTERKQYSFTDAYPEAALMYYRLAQIDFDGTVNYSSVIQTDVLTPAALQLEQNYPNPFNPSTEIRYSIAESGMVTLRIYDVTGAVIATAVNEYKDAGSYVYTFNAAGLAGGTYWYEIQTNGTRMVKSMLLLK